jgi:ring-1,2-phenylacetyl-CoA epoxidase subunit PaaD
VTTTLVERVSDAVAAVDDPEYPGVSIADLGLVESITVDGDRACVDLVPTFLGCPALALIEADVVAAVRAVDGIADAEVRFVTDPPWTPARITPAGRAALRDQFTVAVVSASGEVRCPTCGSTDVAEQSPFGPSPCRAIHRCAACGEPVEVVRT